MYVLKSYTLLSVHGLETEIVAYPSKVRATSGRA
jgi:hypothetical protein